MAEENSTQDQDKTEAPSPRKLSEARKKGQVVHSREVLTFFSLMSALVAVVIWIPWVAQYFFETSRRILSQYLAVQDFHRTLPMLYDLGINTVIQIILPVVGIFALMGVVASMIQHGFVFSVDLVMPKFKKISPSSGIKRIVSKNNALEFIKGFAKIVLSTIIVAIILLQFFPEWESSLFWQPNIVVIEFDQWVKRLLLALTIMMGMVGILDYMIQHQMFMQNMRMSKQEVKDEMKMTEGDPKIKARIRQIRLQKSKKRILAMVPKADVIVTNPTHYAIALGYNESRDQAPKILAKGVDVMAAKIRELALEHQIPLIENPPLARALYKVDLDHEIPPEHYRTVAEIISYVWRLKGKFNA